MALAQHTEVPTTEVSTIVIADRAIFALNHLRAAEAAMVQQVIQDLPMMFIAIPRDPRLRQLVRLTDTYIIRATPEIRLFARFAPGAPIEILDLVMTDTLKEGVGVPDPFEAYP